VTKLIVLILSICSAKNSKLKTNRVDHLDMLPIVTKS